MQKAPALDHVFHALADGTRRRMLAMLARGERTAGELGEPFRISQPAASKHIRALEDAGLVRRRIVGRVHRIRLSPRRLEQAERWIRRHRDLWEHALDALGRALDDLAGRSKEDS